jgi:hypothetical protein
VKGNHHVAGKDMCVGFLVYRFLIDLTVVAILLLHDWEWPHVTHQA